MAKNVVRLLGDLPSAQHGYFTRAQAAAADVEDFDLTRAVQNGFIERVGHGVYRVAGAPYDRHAQLRIAWLRLAPAGTPRARTLRPDIWVSHTSAADLHNAGVFLADVPTFIVVDRLRPGHGVKVHRRSRGLDRNDWTVIDGFAVTSIERTAADLHRAGVDGGHLGRFIQDAINAGATTEQAMSDRLDITTDKLAALVAMADPHPSGAR